MTTRFDPSATFISVEVVLVGLSAFGRLKFALDTGATQTGVDTDVLSDLGFDSSMAVRQISIATLRGWIPMNEFRLPALSALGVDLYDFDVWALDLPDSTFDGVLGMDFFRNRVANDRLSKCDD